WHCEPYERGVDLYREATLRPRFAVSVASWAMTMAGTMDSPRPWWSSTRAAEVAESLTPLQHAAGEGGGSETWERPGVRAREDWHGAPRRANDAYREGGRRSYGRDAGPGTLDFVREQATGHANCSYCPANSHAYASPRLLRTRRGPGPAHRGRRLHCGWRGP